MGLPFSVSCILTVFFAACPSMSLPTVRGIVGHSVTLPCTYPVYEESDVTSMCWGRGWCPFNKCSNEIIWTDGQKVTFQQSKRYHLKDDLSQGIVSLTIENLTEADAGKYCCRVEIGGWFNDKKITMQLEIIQATSPPFLDITTARPSESSGEKYWTIGVNDTVRETSEGYQSDNKTVILYEHVKTNNEGIYIGVCIFAGLLVILIFVLVLKRYFYNRKKAPHLSMNFVAGGTHGGITNVSENGTRAEDNVYTIEDNVYSVGEENAYIIEEDSAYVIETPNGKQQPPKFGHNTLN